MLLGEILLLRGAIDSSQLEKALQLQSQKKSPLGQLLMEQGLIDEHLLKISLQEQYWRVNGYWVLKDKLR